MQKIEVFAAMTEDYLIADRNGQIPWRVKSDLQRFRQMTIGKPVIMGHETFKSMGSKPLDRRFNIVLTRNVRNYISNINNVHFVSSIEDAMKLAAQARDQLNTGSIAIIGGRNVYCDTVFIATDLHITFVHTQFKDSLGTYFPLATHDFNRDWSKQAAITNNRGFKPSDNEQYATTYTHFIPKKQKI